MIPLSKETDVSLILAKIEMNNEMIKKLEFLIDGFKESNKELIKELSKEQVNMPIDNNTFIESLPFSNKLRWYMKKYKVSQMAVAQYLGVSQKAISRYVNGEVVPSKSVQDTIIKYFNRFE